MDREQRELAALLKRAIPLIEEFVAAKKEELISEKEACQMLDISPKTMINSVGVGKYRGCFKVMVNGKRLWIRSKLIAS